MAILKIARMGHPVLLHKAEPVADPGAPEIRRLVADMLETMTDASGAGLAAPQVCSFDCSCSGCRRAVAATTRRTSPLAIQR